MSEEIQSDADAREPWEKKPWIVDPEFDRWVDQEMKENREALAANGFKPFQQEEGNYKVDMEKVRKAVAKANESPIQFDPVDYDEIW